MSGEKMFRIIFLALFCFMTSGVAIAGEIHETYPAENISFVKYSTVDSYLDGNILVRTLKVEVKNTNQQMIGNVKMTIDGLPTYATSSDKELFFGDIAPDTSVLSTDTFQLSVDSEQCGGEVRLIWLFTYELEGTQVMDEIAVIENIK